MIKNQKLWVLKLFLKQRAFESPESIVHISQQNTLTSANKSLQILQIATNMGFVFYFYILISGDKPDK